MDARHICYELAPRYHSRSNLLWFFTDAMATTWDMLCTQTLFEDLMDYTRLELMKFGHNRDEIDQINNLDNIKSIAYDDTAAEYIFNRLWSVHPSVIPELSPPQPNQGEPLGEEIDVDAALAEIQQENSPQTATAELQQDQGLPDMIFQAIQLANSGN
ncbi:MAG: hypothetical protein AB2693_34775 [Candidatus Thiodiazotropha sp.]